VLCDIIQVERLLIKNGAFMEKDILKLTNDLVFKKFFTYKNDYSLLGEFISLVIGQPAENVEVINPEIGDEDIAGKQIVMDLRVKTASNVVNVEMQSYSQKDYVDRALLYSTRNLANNNLNCGDGYIRLSSAYTINILKHRIFPCKEYMSEYGLRESLRGDLLSDKFKIFFFELSKISIADIPDSVIRDPKNDSDRLLLWLLLFKCEKEGDLRMFYSTNYQTMEQAAKRVVEISEDEKTRTVAEMREKAQMDYASAMFNQREEGLEEGIAKGLAQGIGEGILIGVLSVLAKQCNSKADLLSEIEPYNCSEEDCIRIFSERPELKPAYWD
jgi:predicted transposase/invertase (TIGR01784 family)